MEDKLLQGEAASPGTAPPEQAPTAPKDRRRPGRIENVSTSLIPLLRSAAVIDAPAPVNEDGGGEADEGDGLAAARGIALGLALATPFWALIGVWLWRMARG